MPKIKRSSMGLGKPTLRGIKKCPKCGTINGTRGNSCKNKLCNATFKESMGRKKIFTEACRLNTGTSTRVYSVRVRDKGPDHRGFVQLPIVQAPFADNLGLIEGSALCFVDNCERNFNSKVLHCHEPLDEDRGVALCNHICGALRCNNDAEELTLKTKVLDDLSIPETIKKEIRRLCSECSGPAVQRVSKNVMVVKCLVSPKAPLGYLHVSFASGRTEQDLQFYCPCSELKVNGKEMLVDRLRCSHFYACICAFNSQESLRQEFSSYIKLETVIDHNALDSIHYLSKEETDDADCEFTSLFESNGCHVEILQDDVSTLLCQTIEEDVKNMLAKTISQDSIAFSTVDDLDNTSMDTLQVNLDSSHVIEPILDDGKQLASISGIDFVIPSVDLLTTDFQCSTTLQQTENNAESTQLIPLFLETIVEESSPQSTFKKRSGSIKLNFNEWLAGVTDSINQQMHFQFPGESNCLRFHAHNKFFDKLKERILRTKQRYIKSSVTVCSRRDDRPVGSFLKHSWALSSRIHVKSIFDTPQVPLNLVKSFIRNSDGSYEATDRAESPQSSLYKTYLRVGIHRGEKEPVPFLLDWMPSVLPASQVGELTIKFEYGHVPRYRPELDSR